MFGLRAGQRGGGFIPVFGDPAAACHDFVPAFLANTSVILSEKSGRGNRSGER
jgi:hypothetical protein